MPTIKVQVQGKIALNLTPEVILVCGNSDYEVEFEFDNDWAQYETKTAIFVANGEPQEVEFNGNTCKVPIIINSTSCSVGVEAGDLRTTTSAYIVCKRSIRDEAQNAFAQGGGEKYLTNYQKKVDGRLETESKEVVGAINEINAKAGQGGGGGGLTEEEVREIVEENAVTDVEADVVEETNELTIELKDKNGKVIATTKVTLPTQEIPEIDLSGYVKNTDIAKPDGKTYGVVRAESLGSVTVDNIGTLNATQATTANIDEKYRHRLLRCSDIDHAVKVGVTTNTETLTDEEKTSACDWIGALKQFGGGAQNEFFVYGTNGATQAMFPALNGGHSGNVANGAIPRYQYDWVDNTRIEVVLLTGKPRYARHAANKDYVDNLPDYLTLTDEQKAKWKAWLQNILA